MKSHIEKQLKKEALITVVIYLSYFIWWYFFGYVIGDKNPLEYDYVLGFPQWFFYACVLGFIVFSIIVGLVVKIFFKEIPLNDLEYDEVDS